MNSVIKNDTYPQSTTEELLRCFNKSVFTS